MAKLSIKVEQRTFDINVKDEAYNLLANQVKQDLKLDDNNTISQLLTAYLNQCYKSVARDKKIESIVKKLEEH
jgi:hypothetical protein